MFGKSARRLLYKVLVRAADLLYSAWAMSKVQFNCRLDEVVADEIKNESERLTGLERRKVSQAELVEKAWRARGVSCDGQRVIEWLEDDERRPAGQAFTAGVERQVAYRCEDLFQRIDELEKFVGSMNGGEVPDGEPVTRFPDGGDQAARVAAGAEIMQRATSSAVPSTLGSQNHCVHCGKDFPRAEGAKPTSRCKECAVDGHWLADPAICQKCKEKAYYAKKAAEDKVALAAGRDDIVYD